MSNVRRVLSCRRVAIGTQGKGQAGHRNPPSTIRCCLMILVLEQLASRDQSCRCIYCYDQIAFRRDCARQQVACPRPQQVLQVEPNPPSDTFKTNRIRLGSRIKGTSTFFRAILDEASGAAAETHRPNGVSVSLLNEVDQPRNVIYPYR
jgi:hypothetical protein